MAPFLSEIRELADLLRATGKEHLSEKYEEVIARYDQGEPLADIARHVLEIGAEGRHCSYNYMEDRKIGEILTSAQNILRSS